MNKFRTHWNKSPLYYRALILSRIGLTKNAARCNWQALPENVKNLLLVSGVIA